ncbi:FtsQ-type POTRA domain-containing protein [Ruminococcus sp.]|uniref:cell division protein FtsQ/DivIB n=1 Tax=Ruminococcus sp. TaxID=41978 RepID=UPI0025D96875|nr:FtsQ-type POTRA domain-containing protein [Ruminococcus sp.]MBQ8965054.1 FtsQ-type POTRA domain-containing protein [Ruminococcus sp.]
MRSRNDNEPIPAMTPRRAGRKLDLRVLYAAAAVIAAVIILILCMTVFFNVSEVEIKGVTLYTEDQIVSVGGIYDNMNLVRTDVARAEKRLTDNLVYIDKVKVTKSYPSTVVIDCTEAVKAADIEYEGGYYVLSTSGRILEADNPAPTGGIPVITGFRFYTGQDRIDNGEELTDEEIFAFRDAGADLRSEDDYSDKIVMDLLKELEKQEYEDVLTIDITSRANIIMNIGDRLDIKLGSSADIDYKLSYFKAVMGKLVKDYEGTLIYNGSENGVSAIPKDKYLGKPNFGKDPEKPDDSEADEFDENAEPADAALDENSNDSSLADDTRQDDWQAADNGWSDNNWDNGQNWDDGQNWDNGGWSDNTWDDGQNWDNGGWSDNNWDNGQSWDNGWSDNTWDGGNYGW